MCTKPSLQTFVDDVMTTIQKEDNTPLQQTIIEVMDRIELYMNANKLSLNRDKTQLMVLNKNPPLKSQVIIPAQPVDITPKDSLVFLGVTMSDKLNWNSFLMEGKGNLYNQLKVRVSALKKLRTNTNFAFARNLANSLFIGKFNYAAETWGGAPLYIIKRFQSLQLEAARAVIGHKCLMWNTSTILAKMKWMNVKQLLAYTSNKLTYKILHHNQPSLLAARMRESRPICPISTRLSGPFKLGARPPNIGRTKVTKMQYRSKAYDYYSQLPESIQNLSNYKHFTKWMKKHYLYGAVTPYDKLPTFMNLDAVSQSDSWSQSAKSAQSAQSAHSAQSDRSHQAHHEDDEDDGDHQENQKDDYDEVNDELEDDAEEVDQDVPHPQTIAVKRRPRGIHSLSPLHPD